MHPILLAATSAAALEPRRPLPPMPADAPPTAAGARAAEVRGDRRLLVKLRDGTSPSAASAALRGARTRPLVNLDEVSALVARAEARSGRAQPDYGALLLVEPAETGALTTTARALADLGEVEVVWERPGLVALPGPGDGRGGRGKGRDRERERDRGRREAGESPTASYLTLQRYLGPAPGIDARWAWEQGFTGEGVRIADVEFALNRRHEELGRRVGVPDGVRPVDPFDGMGTEHGTAVMGVVVGRPDKAGIRGIAPAADAGFYPVYSEARGWVPEEGLLAACADSSPGDVVMVELQTEYGGAYAPMEVDPAVWMATRTCTDAGVVVVAAAGNGARDLDAADLAFWRDRGDSGAILVGAGTGGADGRLVAESFSNYGRRVDLQGWGSEVFTLGYGDHAVVDADPDRTYTARFAGTSSATPIVAGAAALVQHAAKARHGEPLAPEELRDLLKRTGVRQGPDRRDRPVGPLPDVKAAIRALPKPRRRGPTDDGGGGGGGAAAAVAPAEAGASAVPWWGVALPAAGLAGLAGVAAGAAGIGILGVAAGVLLRRRGSSATRGSGSGT